MYQNSVKACDIYVTSPAKLSQQQWYIGTTGDVYTETLTNLDVENSNKSFNEQ